jgi:hypothetical protein
MILQFNFDTKTISFEGEVNLKEMYSRINRIVDEIKEWTLSQKKEINPMSPIIDGSSITKFPYPYQQITYSNTLLEDPNSPNIININF